MTKAQRIVEAIIEDLSDRRGIGDEWEGIGAGIQREIRAKWTQIVEREMEP